MQFPRIEHIDDILPFIEGKKEFVIKNRDDYTVIDYNFQQDDTFDSLEAMECRGLRFFPDGRIMSRPPAKFFNLGENKSLEDEFFTHDYTLHEKLDGSLIVPIIMQDDSVRLGTKAGITDVSLQCEEESALNAGQMDQLNTFLNDVGITPSFEYTSPNNRIVVRYEEPALTLLLCRETRSGRYLSHEENLVVADMLGLPLAKRYENITIQAIREWKDREGVVLVWPNGYRIKCKADEYVLKHRVKDSITNEKNLIEIILNDGVDDLVGILDDEDWQYVQDYQRDFLKGVQDSAEMLSSACKHAKCHFSERKDVAKWVMPTFGDYKPFVSCFWQVYDGKDAEQVVKGFITKNLATQSKVDNVRQLFTPTT